ncbi:MAG: hypothetical protein ABII64_09975 [Elusimicrobiota bacterium]
MKKQIFLSGIVLFLAVCLAQAARFSIDRDYILKDGKEFLVKGVSYDYIRPEDPPWEWEGNPIPSEQIRARILKDIKDIREMNANVLRISDSPAAVYEGARKEKLFLLQSIWIEPAKDLFEPEFKERQKTNIRRMIDRIHNLNGADYSDIVMAWNICCELTEKEIKANDAKYPETNHYDGEYVSAPMGSTAVECFIAQMADYAKRYEYDSYFATHLVTYSNTQLTVSFLRTDFLDFMSMNLYSHNVWCWYNSPLGSRSGTIYQGFIETFRESYPNKPLLITEFGLSTAPECKKDALHPYGYGGNTEEEQAKGIAEMWNDIKTAKYPVAGGVVYAYADFWGGMGQEGVEIHEKNNPEQWFGVVSIDGESSKKTKVRKKQAYYKLQELFGLK